MQISVGDSRFCVNWLAKTVPWSRLVARICEVTRTAETQAEYLAMPKSKQDEIKDIGGFVGGTLAGPRRVAKAVLTRTLLSLDGDYADPELVFELENVAPYAWALYSTHKHTGGLKGYRLRVLIPLSRPVTGDEYQAISRWVAAQLGIEKWDDTTHEPHRLFYWPSCSQDAPFLSRFGDAPWLDPDVIRAAYGGPEAWRDASRWPVPTTFNRHLQHEVKHAGDPTEKPGLIGAFCRRWGIHEAIREFLGDVYTPGPGADRYTYTAGSSAGGVVVYEGKWVYSHHGTDPVSGRLCNAWDVVRLHRFGHEDEKAPADTPVNRLPSTVGMQDWARGLDAIKHQLVADRMAAAAADFGGRAVLAPVDAGPPDESWQTQLELDRRNQILPTRANYALILTHDERLRRRMRHNLFLDAPCAVGNLPWQEHPGEREWVDADDAGLRCYLEHTWRVPIHMAPLADAHSQVLAAQAVHPVRSYLTSLTWDGVPRLDTWIIDSIGAVNCPYVRAVSRKLLIAGVARIMAPGCKADYMLLLIGGQGTGKSTLVQVMGGPWASDSLFSVHGKEGYEALRGAWLVEVAELSATRKSDVEAVKRFLTQGTDRYREAYGRRVRSYPRQCVFFGTTNDVAPLVDPTGERRYWPVVVTSERPVQVWAPELNAVRDQLWAEAVCMYADGEVHVLTPELEQQAALVQAQHRSDDGLEGVIRAWLEKPIPMGWYEWPESQQQTYIHGGFPYDGPLTPRSRVCAREVWVECLGGKQSLCPPFEIRRINDALRHIEGWRYGPIRHPVYGGSQVVRGFSKVVLEREPGCDDVPF
ncbi:virulence-associated E family protein [uncultured Thiodictyon sp.]|uniref:virulence-associated E family protein n=1 Tax=uncultured Thiodictyon sp. TaxID=1846217 RepID=UPI0025FAB507|nr:virulence-associated E family protein [uncultured Thiodictyon sp.]